jgi:signal transduction histidine kinase/ActR/RegA family two-component response regulator
VIETPDPAVTFRMAMRLQPGLREFHILDDFNGLLAKSRLEAEMPEETRRIALRLLPAKTAQALFAAVENLPPESAVLVTRSQVAQRMVAELAARCPVPIYGQRSPAHREGFVSGATVDGAWHGEAAARLGLRILAGESAASIPIKRDVPLRLIADYAQMRRFGLSFDALPPGVEILNRPLRIWQQHPRLTTAILATLASLCVLVALLGTALRERRRAAAALKNSVSMINATLDATAEGVLAVDVQGRVISYNQRFLELWRIPRALAARHDDAALLAFVVDQLRDPDLFLKRVRELYATPGAEDFDTIEFKDGRTFERRSRPQRLEGRVIGRVWSFSDITERRQAEKKHRLLQADLAHASMLEALGTLAGGIAHDFNNLLTPILGYSQLTLESLPPGHASHADIEAIVTAAGRARDLVKQILNFSRKGTAERRCVTLEAPVREAVQLLRASIPSTIELRCEIHDAARTVLADTSQVHQALLNLCGNAAQALDLQPGKIIVSLEPVEVDATLARKRPHWRPGRYVRLSISDTGPGIEPTLLPRIFDPFFTSKGPGEGTGLGLAVVHGIMHAHEGAVTVETKLGSGSTFRLYFPEIEAPATGQPAPLSVVRTGRSERVLVIDDEPRVLRVTERLLEMLGYDVTACRDPEGALALVRAKPEGFDIVVTDLNMPVLNGLDFARELRRLDANIPVVLATGFIGDGEVEKQATALGIVRIVEKPFTTEALGEAVRAALEQRRFTPAPPKAVA